MKTSIDIPVVGACEIDACAYNTDQHYHARAITIGDGEIPECDTLFRGVGRVHAVDIQAVVGACKISSCRFNDDLECSADSIRVGRSGDNAQCLTYTRQ